MEKQTIKKIKLFPNNTKTETKKVLEQVEKEFSKNGFTFSDDDYELAIAIGGDGTFLNMLNQNKFNSDILYTGINTGTLGFLQEISPDKTSEFIENIYKKQYRIDELDIEETTIENNFGKSKFFSLNDVEISNELRKRAILDLYLDGHYLETFGGDNLIISTQTGSTAHNKNVGGALIHNSLHALQITPIGGGICSEYKCLTNSYIVPSDTVIEIIPHTLPLAIMIDGEKNVYHDVSKIETTVSKKKIKCLRMNNYSYVNVIKDKFLK